MKKRWVSIAFAVAIASNLFVGCYGGVALDIGYYDNSVLAVNAANTDDGGRLDIFINTKYYDTIYNSTKTNLAQRDATAVKIRSGFSNVSVGWNYDIQAIGKKNGKTVAAHFPFYAVSYGGNHQTWIITDQQLQPYQP